MRNYRASLPAFCLVFLGRYLNDNVNGHCCGLVVWILHTLRKYTGMQRRRYILFPQKLKETFVPLHSVGSMADLKMRFCGFFFFSISSSIRNVPYFLSSTKQLLCLLAKKSFTFSWIITRSSSITFHALWKRYTWTKISITKLELMYLYQSGLVK